MTNQKTEGLSASIENYLKVIYNQTRSGQPTSTAALAEALGIRSASVTNMLQKLAHSYPGLVDYRKYYGISLTKEGEKTALQIIRRHRLIEQFLYQILEYPLEKIHQEAEELEHAVSPYFVERLAKLLNFPAFDPHGDPIPDHDLTFKQQRSLAPLSDLTAGQKGIVRHITDQEPEVLLFLNSIGISPGAELEVIQVNPVDGTRQILLTTSSETQVLGKSIAAQIQIEIKKG